jgi:homoserine kinase type II
MPSRLHAAAALDRAAVDAIATRYELGRVSAFALCEGGLINSNFRLDTGRGPRLLRVYAAERLRENVEFELSILAHLSGAGFPCQQPLRARDGELLGTLDGRSYAVLTYLPGRTMKQDELSPAVSAQVGALLARLERLLRGFVPRGAKPSADHALVETLVQEVRPRLKPASVEAFDRDWAEVGPLFAPEREGPPQVVHGDLYYQNVLFDGATVRGIIDFDDAFVGSPFLELALVGMEFATREDNALDEALLSPLLRAYVAAGGAPARPGHLLVEAMRFQCFKFLGYTSPLDVERGAAIESNPYFDRLARLRDPGRRARLAELFARALEGAR